MPAAAGKGMRKTARKKTKGRLPAAIEPSSERWLLANRRWVVLALIAYSALRILVFAAAFPLFNNVDEQYHFASIQMYAQGRWPGKDLPHLDPDTENIVALYSTPEYMNTREHIAKVNLPAPIYQIPKGQQEPYLQSELDDWQDVSNFEAQSTPLYYLLGAAWERFGMIFGMHGWQLAYWIRFLNPIAYAVLVWASYRFIRKVYPERPFLWIAVPALLAVFPQDVYYGINRDVLSAPLAAVALWLMAEGIEEPHRRWPMLGASFFTGLAFLVNVSNCVVYAALAAALWLWWRKFSGSTRNRIGLLGGFIFSSLALPVAWMLRNYAVMGDLTGSRAKIAYLGWTMKPLGEIFDHPLFSLSGLWYFLSKLIVNFWRGEYVWYMERMRWIVADRVYQISSIMLLLVFLVTLFKQWKSLPEIQRLAGVQALLLVVGSVLFMAAISLPFDYHSCPYPSRKHPFFVSGRIIAGALLSFVLIYTSGLQSLLRNASLGGSAGFELPLAVHKRF